jgi:periplasmic divalent cation tolerance protein
MADYIQVSTTTDKKEDAEKITREVVKNRLAACAQVMGPITSTYWWEGKIEKEEEWLCIMKSRSDLYNSLERAIKGIHSYDVPEILAVPVIAGNRDYLEWLDRETEMEKAGP